MSDADDGEEEQRDMIIAAADVGGEEEDEEEEPLAPPEAPVAAVDEGREAREALEARRARVQREARERKGAGRHPLRVDELVHGHELPTLEALRDECEMLLLRTLDHELEALLRCAGQLADAVDRTLVPALRKIAAGDADAVATARSALAQVPDPFVLRKQTEAVRRVVGTAAQRNAAFVDAARRVDSNFQLAMINVSTHRFNTATTPVMAHVQYMPTTLAIDTALHAPSLPTPTGASGLSLRQMPMDMFQQ